MEAKGAEPLSGHVIVAGFGLPGRAVGEVLCARGASWCVIELNPQTVSRCAERGVPVVAGDCRREEVLLEAGIQRASMVVLAVPDEKAVLEAVRTARRLNPTVRILARCHYTSAGLLAGSLGADAVVVAEQVVAREFERLLG